LNTECAVADTAKIYLPTPPSLNNIFVTNKKTGGRFASKKYADWKIEAGWEIQGQKINQFNGLVEISILIKEPKRKSDIDNKIKAVLDLLVEHKIIKSDDNTTVRKVSAAWGGHAPCLVTVEEII
jgi:Holliday junction resolvase RusA-like endonuclease